MRALGEIASVCLLALAQRLPPSSGASHRRQSWLFRLLLGRGRGAARRGKCHHGRAFISSRGAAAWTLSRSGCSHRSTPRKAMRPAQTITTALLSGNSPGCRRRTARRRSGSFRVRKSVSRRPGLDAPRSDAVHRRSSRVLPHLANQRDSAPRIDRFCQPASARNSCISPANFSQAGSRDSSAWLALSRATNRAFGILAASRRP
jgi:hypothetical protein